MILKIYPKVFQLLQTKLDQRLKSRILKFRERIAKVKLRTNQDLSTERHLTLVKVLAGNRLRNQRKI